MAKALKTLTGTAFLVAFAFCLTAQAQLISKRNVEFSGGYAHTTGDQGLDGFDVGAALYFTPRVTIGFDYVSGWDTSTLTPFAVSSVGTVSTHSHLQDFVVGPRIFFPGLIKSHKDSKIRLLKIFGEAQFGVSTLSAKISAPQSGVSESSNDQGFTWLLGAGADYRLSRHWAARPKIDFERTHLASAGQSRLRIGLGVNYTFGTR